MSKRSRFYISPDYAFQDKSRVYVFSNECVSGGIDALGDLQNRRILSVCASGDQALDCYYKGASRVDTFDINSYQECIYELKTHMVRHLDYDDFLKFFFKDPNGLSLKMLAPISHNFSSRLNGFLKKYKRLGEHAYSLLKVYDDSIIDNTHYLRSKSDYLRLRERLPDGVSFRHCDSRALTANFSERYDVIILSNIFDYVYPDSLSKEEQHKNFFMKYLMPLAEKNLKADGCIVARYIWAESPTAWTNFADYFQREYMATSEYKLGVRCVRSYHDDVVDMVMLLKRQAQK
ncbi:MAG: DUF3419 family protein [Alphaproteobacteria bacterium]|nr:DUF3419 family protein [Alphaproteobacteria bacterium]